MDKYNFKVNISSFFSVYSLLFDSNLIDLSKYLFQDCIVYLFGLLSVFMLTFIVTNNFGKVLYTIWVTLIFFSFSGIYSLFPAVVAQTYGPTHANTIYGMLFTAPVSLHFYILIHISCYLWK